METYIERKEGHELKIEIDTTTLKSYMDSYLVYSHVFKNPGVREECIRAAKEAMRADKQDPSYI